MYGRGLVVMLAMAGALLGVNCGGDSESEAKNGASSTGGTSNAGAPCGSKFCALPEGYTEGEPCCISQFEGTCGVVQGSGCVEPPPLSPSGCPSVGSGNLAVIGCCTPTGQCGLDINSIQPTLMLGCIDLATAAAFMPPGADGGFSFDLPSPRPCPNP